MIFKRFRFSAQHVRYLRLQYWRHPPLSQSGWICLWCPVLLSLLKCEEVHLDGFCVNRETGALSSHLHRGKANLIHISEVWRLRSFEDSLHEIIFSGASLIVPSFLPHRKPLISLLSTGGHESGGVVSHWCKFAKTLREMSRCHASWSVPEPQIQLSFPLELCDWMC